MIMDFEDLKPLVMLDPLLLPLLVYVCRIEELPGVISVIPPYLSAALLVKLLSNKSSIPTDKVGCFYRRKSVSFLLKCGVIVD